MNKPKSSVVSIATTSDRIKEFFQFEQLETTYRTEMLAGVTSWIAIAPFTIVCASILSRCWLRND